MQLRAVKVRNIRSYTTGSLSLGPGTTLLVGDVGSGKTSLLYAIEMALFGFAEVEPAFLVRHRAHEAEVALTLVEGESTYEFRRKFRRRTVRGRESFEIEESSYSVDGARTRYSATELRQRAIDLLGFPDNPNPRAHSDVWRWAVYIPQERMRDVLLQPPAERLETVRKALGLEQYQVAAENAAEVASELRRVAEVHEAEAEQLRHWTEELPRWSTIRVTRARELAELESEEVRRRAERGRAEEALGAATTLRGQREEEKRARERIARELEKLRRELEQKKTLARSREGESLRSREEAEGSLRKLEEIRAVAEPPEEVGALLRELDRRLTDSEETVRAFGQAEAGRDAAERALAEGQARQRVTGAERTSLAERLRRAEEDLPAKAPVPPVDRDLPTLDAEARGVQAEMDRAREKLAREQHVTEELQELLQAGTCPRCHQTVRPEEFHLHFEEARARERAAAGQLAELTERKGALEEERAARSRYEPAMMRFQEAQRTVQHLREELERTEARWAETERLLEGRAAEMRSNRATVERLAPRVAERNAWLAERAPLLERRNRAEAMAQQVARGNEGIRSARERATLLGEEASRLRSELSVAEEQAAALQAEREEIERRWQEGPDLDRVLTEARSEVDRTRAEFERVLTRLAATRAAIEEADRWIAEADRGVRLRSERIAEGTHLRALAGWVGRDFREGLLDLEHRRLAQAQSEFNRAFARYFQTLVEDPNLLARCDVAFSPSVEIDGESTPAEALSGGERTALALAYRLAMGRVVRGLGRLRLESIVLDEPTDGFSPEQVSRMGELLEELELPQVLLVSHETALAGVADRVIRVRKEGGSSRVFAEEPGPEEEPPASAEAPRAPEMGTREPPRPRRARKAPITTTADGIPSPPTGGSPPPADSR